MYKQGKYKEAESQLSEALSLQPTHILAMNNMAAVMCKMGDFGKAAKYCETALEIDPNHAMSHRNLAKILDTR